MKAVKSKDFERLAVMIFERTGTRFSPTTLKRIWGYLHENTTPRQSTLDLLAQYSSWSNFDDFVKGDRPEIESGFVDAKVLNADIDVRRGEVVRLMWQPNRMIEAKYLGGGRWEVIRAEGTRLAEGDQFNCSMIMSGEPLYLGNVVHNGVERGVYVCGRRHGVTFARKS